MSTTHAKEHSEALGDSRQSAHNCTVYRQSSVTELLTPYSWWLAPSLKCIARSMIFNLGLPEGRVCICQLTYYHRPCVQLSEQNLSIVAEPIKSYNPPTL